jgi:hypothetical protein
MNKRLVTPTFAILGAMVFVSSAQAQRGRATVSASVNRMGTGVSRISGRRTGFLHQRERHHSVGDSAFFPYFYPDYYDYSDYDPEPARPEATPQIIIGQTAQPAAVPAPPPAEPLVLELRGDQWVRITNKGQTWIGGQPSELGSEGASNPFAKSTASPRRSGTSESSSQLPPAVLVFRDGHKEEIGKYMILGATIYSGADYWSSGSWTRKIPIGELDVPATLKLNQERGTKFSLPSGPSEVIIHW